MALIINPANGQVLATDDPTGYYQLGYRDATPDELDHAARVEEFGGFEQQAQAQLERVVRGATLGAVEGFGDDPKAIRARAEVSEELSPVTSLAANILPDVGVAALTGGLGGLATGAGRAAARASLAEGAGLLRAGLAAGRAGGAAALAGESLGTAAVGAGQSAYAEGRELFEDPGRDAENALIWGGLNFGLGAFMLRRGAGVVDEALEDGGEAAARELDDIAAAAEVRHASELPAESIPGTPGQIFDVEGAPPTAAEAPFVPLETQLDEGLAGMSPEARMALERSRARQAQAGMIDFGQMRAAPGYDQLSPTAARRLDDLGMAQPGRAFSPEAREAMLAQLDREQAIRLEKNPKAALAAEDVEALRSFLQTEAPKDFSWNPRRARAYGRLIGQQLEPGDSALEFVTERLNGDTTFWTDEKLYEALERGISEADVAKYKAGGLTRDQAVAAGKGAALEPEPSRAVQALRRLRERATQGGSVELASGIAQSPLGTVLGAGAGAALGGAIGGDTESIAAGGALGGALGIAATALGGRFGRRLQAAAVRQGEREAVEGGMERALRNASKSDAADVVERAIGPVQTVEREADSFGRQRRLYVNRKEIRQVATREMQKDLTELVENVRQVSSVEKLAAVSQHVSDNLAAQRAVAKGIAEQAAQFAGELKAEARAYGAAAGKKGLQYAIPGQRDLTLALMDHAKEITKASDGRALFEALDGFKRTAQEHKLALERGMLNSESSLHYEKLIPRVEEFAGKIRSALENGMTWGRAGEMQRAYNAVLSERLIPQMRNFESAVLKRTHQGYDGLWKTEGWEGKIRSLLADADGGNRRHVVAALDAMDELAGVVRKYGDKKQADTIASQAGKVRRTIGLADELADAEERMHALGNMIGGGPMGGFVAGGLAGGLPGAMIGAALPGAVRGLVMGDLIQAFQRLSGATDAAVQRGVDDWIRSSRVRSPLRDKLPKMPQLSDEARQLRDVAARRGITQSMALFMGEDSTPTAAYQRLSDKLLDERAFFEDLAKEYGTLQEEAPEVFMMLAAQADMDRRYLIQRMPPNVAVSAANPNGYPPSRESIEDWAEFVNTVRYPMRAAQNIGALSVQQIETLRERRPRVHELLQQRVLEGIARARELGEQIDDAKLARIGLLFPDADGFASPVFSRELGQVVVDYNLAKRERERGGGPSSAPPDKRGQLPAQAMAQNGATFGAGYT